MVSLTLLGTRYGFVPSIAPIGPCFDRERPLKSRDDELRTPALRMGMGTELSALLL